MADSVSASDPNYPSLNGHSTLDGAKESFANSKSMPLFEDETSANSITDTQAALNSVQNAPLTQNIKETVSNGLSPHVHQHGCLTNLTLQRSGPVAEGAKKQYSATQNEFSSLANARQTPTEKTATGQPLTHYHSMFYSLLSWENPRATAITFLANVLFIFAARYLNVIRYLFKLLYFTLGVTASAEVAGKLLFSNGFTSQIRPRKYYVIPKETLEIALDDVQELINFFVIEFQRIVFAENVIHTIAAFAASLASYLLIKFVPLWGLALIGTCVVYLTPLVYLNNKEFIDTQVANASDVVSKQATQVKDIAGHHTAQATGAVKSYATDYSSKAQQYIGNARGRSGSPLDVKTTPSNTATTSGSTKVPGSTSTNGAAYSSTDFPAAPKTNPTLPVASEFTTGATEAEKKPLLEI